MLTQKMCDLTTVYFHGSCADGIIAREILKKILSPSVEYIPFYFTELKAIPSNALFIDCSPRSNQLEECLKNGCLVADHHDTFKEGYERLELAYPGSMMFGENSMGESGAVLAAKMYEWADMYETQEVKEIARLIGISDTWKTDSPDFQRSRQLAKYVMFFGNDFNEDLVTLMEEGWPRIQAMGKAFERQAKALAKSAIWVTAASNHKLAFVNELNMSDAAELLRQEGADVIVGWSVKTEPTGKQVIVYSLRTREGGVNAAAFCQTQGGGGHKAAAGCSIEPRDITTVAPIQKFLDLFEAWA